MGSTQVHLSSWLWDLRLAMWYHGSGGGQVMEGLFTSVIRKQREGVRQKNTSKLTVVVTPVTPAPEG